MSTRRGFSLIELLTVMIIVGVLASFAVQSLHGAVRSARVASAIADIRNMSVEIQAFFTSHNRYPTSLAEAGLGARLDPWGRPYMYGVISGNRNVGLTRKDRFLVPLNTDFDLYSIGADGVTAPPLSAPQSRDDVLRARDGGFIGLGGDF